MKPDTETNTSMFEKNFPPKCNLQFENSKSYLKNMFLVKAICGEAFPNEIVILDLWPSRKVQCSKLGD